MTAGTRRAGALVALSGLVLLTGCVQPGELAGGVPTCTPAADDEVANGVVLMAQSVPTASWVPCMATVPLGWRFAGMEASDDAARFWLDSDRDGTHAIEVQLTEDCDTEGAIEIGSDRDGLDRLERVFETSPRYVGTRFYTFDGGCISMLFTLSGQSRGEALAVATEGIDVVSREELRAQVREETHGRLDLDPAEAVEGRP